MKSHCLASTKINKMHKFHEALKNNKRVDISNESESR